MVNRNALNKTAKRVAKITELQAALQVLCNDVSVIGSARG